MTDLAIETTSLTKRFGRVVAVDDLELAVPRGSVYGYLGRNGAGKTTTIQMLMGFLEPTRGAATVLDFDPLRDEVPMKTVVSYVPEQVQMYDWMTVQRTMWFGANTHPRWDQKLADDLVKRFELPPDRRLGNLSRGMLGKVALTFALSSHPEVLILDDPTSGLDALVRREFMESIVGILQQAGTTVFFSSHIIDDVERVADWIGILHEGKLIPDEELYRTV
ncbi:MAG: ABC transporter ATP-binding protein [Armatimonadota bacterium]